MPIFKEYVSTAQSSEPAFDAFALFPSFLLGVIAGIIFGGIFIYSLKQSPSYMAEKAKHKGDKEKTTRKHLEARKTALEKLERQIETRLSAIDGHTTIDASVLPDPFYTSNIATPWRSGLKKAHDLFMPFYAEAQEIDEARHETSVNVGNCLHLVPEGRKLHMQIHDLYRPILKEIIQKIADIDKKLGVH